MFRHWMQSTDDSQVTLGGQRARVQPEAATACVLFRTLRENPNSFLAGATGPQLDGLLQAMQEVHNGTEARRRQRARREAWKRALRLLRALCEETVPVRPMFLDLEPRFTTKRKRKPELARARILNAELSEPARNARGPLVFLAHAHGDLDALKSALTLPLMLRDWTLSQP
jgi:hypothetical protein